MSRRSKRILVVGSIFLITGMLSQGYAYKFDFVTVTDIVRKVKKKFSEVDSYQANFVINSEKLGRTSRQTGIIKYKAENRMIIDFYAPQRHSIVSNGKMMWIHIPSMNVVAEQSLKSDSGSLFSSGTKSGLRRLFSKYHYRFSGKEQPAIQPDGSKAYVLFLKQKESRGGFRTLKLWISDQFMITRAFGTTATGKKVEIEFNDIKTDVSFSNGMFRFDIPSNARVIKNPMISEE
ncbi:MAG TPA: outer-membrane lipoprotein carrier protein LolA [Spirochaetota bacterium]|nr:outer-membrane lipoprotein carrier protein LolA [Spirochaetota bacterium]HQO01914.1 outer-membrane lipoprotein carrier protein LolA [Spirochaetota bacterium]HQP49097.1 outer-membrane lipoprotein carrier protein LolA [Spirochaetota bacterium]